MPVPSNHHINPSLPNHTESIRTNTDNAWIGDDLASILSGSHKKNDMLKMSATARSKVEVLRANSPTLKRLLAARIKLDKYITFKLNTISTSQQSIHAENEISSAFNDEKNPTANVRTSSSSKKRIKSQTTLGSGPLDKITYEKTRSRNGSIKQKCSLEIWLPKAGPDDDDGHTSRPTSPDPNLIEKRSQSPQIISTKARRSSVIKTTASIETKSVDETSSKKSDPTVIPRVYHYEDYLTDQPEERPRSGRNSNTNKADNNGTNKYIKHQCKRSNNRRTSPSTNHTEETALSGSSGKPMSSKNLLANIKQTSPSHETKGTTGSNNSQMINELMRKYSMIKKSHQELTQAKLQLEKSSHDSKHNTHIHKDRSLLSPPVSDSLPHSPSDPPTISGKRLLGDSSPPRSAGDHLNTNTKILDRRSSHYKSSYPEIFPQARLFSIVNPLQHRQTSAFMPPNLLPAVIIKKTDDTFHSLHRSKTLDVNFDVPIDNPNKISSRLPIQPDDPDNTLNYSNLLQHSTNRYEQTSPRISKRSLPPPLLTLRSDQQPRTQLVQYQNVQNSAQRYHHSEHSSTTSVSTNKVLVHLKYSNGGNIDRNCLIPD